MPQLDDVFSKPVVGEKPRQDTRYGHVRTAPGSAPPTEASAPRDANYGVPSAPAKLAAAERALLNFFTALSAPTRKDPAFTKTLQEVKGFLYNKEYEEAFGTEARREAYAARWVPSRAIIYRRIMRESAVIRNLLTRPKGGAKCLLLGGGAGSEMLGLGAVLSSLLPNDAGEDAPQEGAVARQPLDVTVVDSSDWSQVIQRQQSALLKTYGNLDGRFSVDFALGDILNLPPTIVDALPTTNLITILFTITELLLQSRAQTLAFLSTTLSACAPGTLLLIVESAALATIPVGTSGRTYPLTTLLDHALTADRSREERAKWEEIEGVDERWYRQAPEAAECYPIKLENSRCVLRLLRRVPDKKKA